MVSTASPSGLQCPLCRQIDAVQSVQSIISSGTVRGGADIYARRGFLEPDRRVGSSYSVNTTDLVQSILQHQPGPCPGDGGWGTVSVLTVAALSIFGVLSLAALVGVHPNFQGERTSGDLLFFTISALISFGIVWFIIQIKKPENRSEEFEAVRQWEQKVADWNQSFYCARCHNIFVRRS